MIWCVIFKREREGGRERERALMIWCVIFKREREREN
jgi:hypothetical protein